MDDWEKSFSKLGNNDKPKPSAMPRPSAVTNRPVLSTPPAKQTVPVKPAVVKVPPSISTPSINATNTQVRSSTPWVYFVLAVLYFVSPLDFIPDWIVGVGQGDDFSLLLYTGMNLWQKNYMDPQDPARNLLKYGKILVAVIGIILVLIAFLVLGALALIIKSLVS